MLRDIAETIPPPILIGVLAYGAVSAALAPEMTIRFGQKSAVPRCVAGVQARQPGFDGGAIARELTRSMLGMALRHLGESPGGHVAGRLSDRHGQAVQPEAASSLEARCQCLLRAAAFDSQVRFDGAVWIGSFRLIEGSGVSALDGHMARKNREGFCKPEDAP